ATILGTRAVFSEDQQTYYGQGWNGATALYLHHHPGLSQDVWYYEQRQPRDWGTTTGEQYRRTSTSMNWPGIALSARLLGAQGAWNHPAFFDYTDRWMEEDDDADRAVMRQQLGGSYISYWDDFAQKDARYTTSVSQFVRDMWRTYRHAGSARWQR
ncbi:MAG: hypothetical protein AB1505_20015, partial [Candidatus Latescibacterota bacterium]